MALRLDFKETEVGLLPADWECTNVNEIASPIRNAIVGGPFGSDLVSADYVQDGVPVIRGQNMSSKYLTGPYVFVSQQKAKKLEANLAHPGDLVFTQRGTLGQVSIVPNLPFDCYLVSQSQMKVTVNNKLATTEYLYYLFNSSYHQNLLILNTIQTGLPHINLGILRAIPVQLPPLPEQFAITAALSDVDALLASLDALIAKKRAIKQGAMQELLTGKRRLSGFCGEWEVKKLGEVLRLHYGKSQKGISSHGGINPILGTGGVVGRTDSSIYDKPSIIIGRKGTIDIPQYVDCPFWAIDTTFYTEIGNKTNPKFLYYLFSTVDWRSFNEASGVPSLSAQTIERIDVPIPNEIEQTAIAAILTDMDGEIKTLEQQRDKTHLLKQGMMQELLTGKTRLI